MSITTMEAFLEAIRKSKLLSAEQIAGAREAAASLDRPKSLARLLFKQNLLTEWQAGQLLAGRESFFLGRYKLIDLLGRGAMGSVFFAEDTKMSRPVALKIISKQLGRDPAALERFFAEARTIAAFDHPNIVRAYDVDSASNRYFIVMEFAEGRNLQQVVQSEGALSYGLAADYVRQAAEGLAHAHDREIVHRDVKPANLVVNDRGVVKVLDMGMARLVVDQADTADTVDDGLLGTVDYLAPEQAMGAPEADHRVDLYSLGCTLYFLLTGGPPFPEGTLAERIVKHQTQDPPSVRDMRADAPQELVDVCEKLMAKDPADRFASADEVAGLLADWQPPQEEPNPVSPVAAPVAEKKPKKTIQIAEPLLAEKAAQSSGPLDIKIDTSGPSIGRRTNSPAGGREDNPSPPIIEQLLADRRIVIAACVGGAILLLGIIAGLFFLSWGNDRTDVADATPDESSRAAEMPGSDKGRAADKDAKGVEDEESLREPGITDNRSNGLKAPVTANPKQEPRGPRKPQAEPAPKPVNPKKPAEQDSESPPDAAKPAGEPETDPAEPKKPQGDAEKKPDQGTEPTTDTPEPSDEPKPPQTVPSSPPRQPVKPLERLKEVVAIPELGDEDPPGEASRSPLSMGPINAPDEANVQLFLLGGDQAIKGDPEFTVAAETGAAASWLIQLDETQTGGERNVSPVARVSRAGKGLSFQWADEAQSTSANYLRNCILQVRLEGQSKYLQLAEPVIGEPIILDLTGGRASQTVPMKWLPDTDNLRIAIIGFEGREDFSTQPEEPVPPKTPIGLVFTRRDRHGNSSVGVQFRVIPAMRRSTLNFDVRMAVTPDIATLFKQYEASRLSLQQLGTAHDKLASEKSKLTRQLTNAKGADRSELSRKIDILDTQLWYLDFYTAIHERAEMHYRIFVMVDGRELVLATSTTKPIKPPE